jgi:hypothetical protein
MLAGGQDLEGTARRSRWRRECRQTRAMPSWLEGTPAKGLDAGPVLLRRWRLTDAEVLDRLVTDN